MYYGKKVKLRAYKEEDINKAWIFVNDKEVRSLIAAGTIFPISLKEERNFIEKPRGKNEEYNFAIETLESESFIGGCSVKKVNWVNRNCEIGIMIGDKDYWNKEYGTDAIKTLLKFIFDEMNLNKVKLGVFGFNKRAIRSYEKCGFKIEGTEKNEIFRNGEYHDRILMAIFKEDFLDK